MGSQPWDAARWLIGHHLWDGAAGKKWREFPLAKAHPEVEGDYRLPVMGWISRGKGRQLWERCGAEFRQRSPVMGSLWVHQRLPAMGYGVPRQAAFGYHLWDRIGPERPWASAAGAPLGRNHGSYAQNHVLRGAWKGLTDRQKPLRDGLSSGSGRRMRGKVTLYGRPSSPINGDLSQTKFDAADGEKAHIRGDMEAGS